MNLTNNNCKKELQMTRIALIGLTTLCLAAAAPNTHRTSETQQQVAVNACLITGVPGVELASCNLEFNGLGEIVLGVKNRGSVSTAGTQGGRRAVVGPPIGIDLYMQNQLIISLSQQALGAGQSKTITTGIPSNFSTPACGESRALKLVVDSKNAYAEGSESDNTLTRDVARPCPDLAIKSIKRDYEGMFGETYRVKVTIINQGNAPSPSNQIWASSLPGEPWPVNGWPALTPTETIPALAPGETTSFKVGGTVLASNRTAIRIMLDRYSVIAELDESNNMKDERL